jgi:GGDEF domain-containing protein
MIREVMRELQLVDTFIGQIERDKFVIILPEKFVRVIREKLKTRFDTDVLSHYHDIHRKLGYIWIDGGRKNLSFMKLAIGIVSPTHHNFSDIKEIMEIADYACAQDE